MTDEYKMAVTADAVAEVTDDYEQQEAAALAHVRAVLLAKWADIVDALADIVNAAKARGPGFYLGYAEVGYQPDDDTDMRVQMGDAGIHVDAVVVANAGTAGEMPHTFVLDVIYEFDELSLPGDAGAVIKLGRERLMEVEE